jgi:hypothetical protein
MPIDASRALMRRDSVDIGTPMDVAACRKLITLATSVK